MAKHTLREKVVSSKVDGERAVAYGKEIDERTIPLLHLSDVMRFNHEPRGQWCVGLVAHVGPGTCRSPVVVLSWKSNIGVGMRSGISPTSTPNPPFG